MRVLALLLVLLVIGAGCGGDPLAQVDEEVSQGLAGFLLAAARGETGCHDFQVQPVGEFYIGEISGSAARAAAGAQVVSYSFWGDELAQIEVDRCQVQEDGSWGPLTVLAGPKAVVLEQDGEILASWFAPRPFIAVDTGQDLAVRPEETALVALALYCAGEYQAAADILANLQDIHSRHQGLVARSDIFGTHRGEVDAAATGWAGYTVALLAAATNHDLLWEEARTYAGYLEGLAVPDSNRERLAPWLLFTKLAEQFEGYQGLAEIWQPVAEGYDPYRALALTASGSRELMRYVTADFEPPSLAERWLHYNALAAADLQPPGLAEALEQLQAVSGGLALVEEGEISLAGTSWMLIALSGHFR